MLQRALSLHQLCLIGSRIDVNQRISLVDKLPFTVMHRSDDSVRLRDDRRCVDGRHGANGIEVNADRPLFSSSDSDGDGWLDNLFFLCGRCLVPAVDNPKSDPTHEKQNNQDCPKNPRFAIPFAGRGKLMIPANVRNL